MAELIDVASSAVAAAFTLGGGLWAIFKIRAEGEKNAEKLTAHNVDAHAHNGAGGKVELLALEIRHIKSVVEDVREDMREVIRKIDKLSS